MELIDCARSLCTCIIACVGRCLEIRLGAHFLLSAQAFEVTVEASALPVPAVWLETLLCCGRWSSNGGLLTRSPATLTYYFVPDTRPAPWDASPRNITAGQLAASLSVFSLWDTAGYD